MRARAFARLLALVAPLAAGLAVVPEAFADLTKDQCIGANTQAQTYRRAGKLAAARAELQACGTPACPAIIRDDCTHRMEELESAQPTILFEAKDGAGRDLVAVKVTMDGQPFADRVEGKALPVDPGAHEFTFTEENQPPVTQTFVLREGEKERRERIVLGPPPTPAAPAPATPLPATPPAETPSSGMGTQQVLGLAVAGAGVVGLGVGTVFGLLAGSAWSSAKSACGGDPSHCTNVSSADSYKSTTTTDGAVSTVAFIAGGVLVAGGAVLFLTGGHRESTTVAVTPAVGPGQGGLLLYGKF